MNTTIAECKNNPTGLMPREKMELYGAEQLSDAELLAVLLHTGNRQKNVLELAEEILHHVGGVTEFRDIALQELMELDGIGASKATTVLAAREFGKRVMGTAGAYRTRVASSSAAAEVLIPYMANYDREHFMILLLNQQKELIGIETISIGTLSGSPVHPREVFKNAIRRSASSIILAHNHPGGSLRPSGPDMQVTRRLKEAGQLIGIEVVDHIIVAGGNYYSFLEEGQI